MVIGIYVGIVFVQNGATIVSSSSEKITEVICGYIELCGFKKAYIWLAASILV